MERTIEMAWMVFGTFFLIDAHAAWYWYAVWAAACLYDLKKEADDKNRSNA